MTPPKDILLMLSGWFLLAWFAVGLSFIVGSLMEFSPFFQRIWSVFTYIMFPLSGAVFMLDWMPPNLRELLLYDRHLDSILGDGRAIIRYEHELSENVFVLRLKEYLRTILNRYTTMDLRRGIEITDTDKFLKTMKELMDGTILNHLNES